MFTMNGSGIPGCLDIQETVRPFLKISVFFHSRRGRHGGEGAARDRKGLSTKRTAHEKKRDKQDTIKNRKQERDHDQK